MANELCSSPSALRTKRRRLIRSVLSKLEDDHLSAPSHGYSLRSRRLSCSEVFSPSAPRTKRGIQLEGSPISSKLEDDDILLEILIRLPNPRIACRCKPVCKRWNSLLSTPYFNSAFVSHHQSKRRNAQEPPSDPSSILTFIPLPDEIRPLCKILDSFKDLLLCGFNEYTRYHKGYNDQLQRLYLVCNWFTKQWIALPLVPERTMIPAGLVARLVCEPLSKNSNNKKLESGDAQVFGLCSEYRFRVVCMYQDSFEEATVLDVFCSESGKWTKEALFLNGYLNICEQNIISSNGKLWWSYFSSINARRLSVGLFEFNPFHLDIPPTIVHVPPCFTLARMCNIAVSQGSLCITSFEITPGCRGLWHALSVWRQVEVDGKRGWERLYRVLLNNISRLKDMQVSKCYACDLHPEKPEIVYLELFASHSLGIFSFNLRSGELELVEKRQYDYQPHYMVFHIQPRVTCWPTPIHRHEKLKGVYDGSYDCLVQSSQQSKNSSRIKCIVDRVELSSEEGQQMNITPHGRLKKQQAVVNGVRSKHNAATRRKPSMKRAKTPSLMNGA